MKIISCLFLTAVISLGQDAKKIHDPELDFVENSLLFKSSTKKDEIVRRDVDLTGEGQTTILLRASVGGGKCGQYWTAYVKNSDMSYQRYEDIEFREDTFRDGKVPVFNPEGGILAYYPGKGAGDLIQISFDSGEAESKKLRTLVVTNPEDQAIFESIFGRKMGEPLPDEFFKNPAHKVISVAEIIARPQTSNREVAEPKNADSESDKSHPVANPQVSEKRSEPKKVQAPSKRTQFKSWSIVAALIATAICLLWLLFKKSAGRIMK